LTVTAKMDAKMSTSCSSREALDQASAPESMTAAALAGCGDSSSPHRISDSAGKDGGFVSLSPSAGGPAVVAGIRAGDREVGGSEAETGAAMADRVSRRGRGDGTGAATVDRASRWGQRRWE
jgi:hypothetical protein